MKKYKYDAFLSHSSKDKNEVFILYRELAKSLNIFIDAISIGYGSEITLAVKDAINKSRYIIACYTNEYFASDWVQKELHTILFADPLNRNNKILPVLLKPCNIPDFYSSYKYIDLTKDYQSGVEELLNFIKKSIINNASKPKLAKQSPKEILDKISNKLVRNIKPLDEMATKMLELDISYSVIYLDIDNFTMINIVHGGKVGDEIINQILSIYHHESTILRHWYADEFILLCKNCSMEKAHKISEAIIELIRTKDWTTICNNLFVSVSLGYAAAHRKGSEYDGFFYTLERAIIGCKKAKQSGKGMIGLGPVYLKIPAELVKKQAPKINNYIHYLVRRYSS